MKLLRSIPKQPFIFLDELMLVIALILLFWMLTGCATQSPRDVAFERVMNPPPDTQPGRAYYPPNINDDILRNWP